MENNQSVREQVEFYLSDGNLCKDSFFYNKILEDKEGYLDFDLIMNCNKIKNLKLTKDQVKAAIKDSGEVELNSDGTKIRRKGNKSLPEPKFTAKKLKTEKGSAGSQRLISCCS